jgi:hypothetical protein
MSVLVVATGAYLAAYFGGLFPSAGTQGVSTSSEGYGPACAAFATSYKAFLNGYVPNGATEATPLQALGDAITNISSAAPIGLQVELTALELDAYEITIGSNYGVPTASPSKFDSDLKAVGDACRTTFAPPPASLLVHG